MRFVKTSLVAVLLLSSRAVLADAPETLLKTVSFRGSVVGFPIAGIPSGGRDWVIASGEAKLEADGTFKVEVEGLVFAPGSVVGGNDVSGTTGPVTHFAATLVCLLPDGTHVPVATTPGFAVTTTGDGAVKTRVALPSACYAPIVLVRSFNPTSGLAGNWFAASGF